jgi:hypothetical protein
MKVALPISNQQNALLPLGGLSRTVEQSVLPVRLVLLW